MRTRTRMRYLIGLGVLICLGSQVSQAVNLALLTNPYSARTGHPYRNGAVPTRTAHARSFQWLESVQATYSLAPATVQTKTLSYGGSVNGIGVTSGAPRVYLVVWGTQWGSESTSGDGIHTYSADTQGAVALLQRFFRDVGNGHELWSGVLTQYCDGAVPQGATTCPAGSNHVKYPAGGALAGIWYDGTAKSPVIASAHDLAAEAVKAANHFNNSTADSNRYVQYVILSPPGTHPDRFNTGSPDAQFCAWHDYTSDPQLDGGPVPSDFGGVAFTNMPYVTDAEDCGAHFVNSDASGALDGVTINAGHEYAETLTDQLPVGGWTNQSTIPALQGEENADECSWIAPGAAGGAGNVQMGSGTYAVQSTWSNDTNQCALAHPVVP